jgi:hypothetical protein
MRTRVPRLDKADAPFGTLEEHARALELACRAAAQIIASNPDRASADFQGPLPESTIRLLRRLPRCHG